MNFVHFFSDRFRTTINVMCDALGTILVNHLSKNDLASVDRVSVEKQNTHTIPNAHLFNDPTAKCRAP